MKKYLGVKLIEAEPMNRAEQEGYSVKYEDGYTSWSPKEVFEKAYFELAETKKSNSISEEDISNFIKNIEAEKIGEKTTIVTITCVNGFEFVETSSCVDPANFDMELGTSICVDRAKNKIWGHLGFLLQCGIKGFK